MSCGRFTQKTLVSKLLEVAKLRERPASIAPRDSITNAKKLHVATHVRVELLSKKENVARELPFNCHRYGVASAQTQRSNATFHVAPFHLIEQGHKYASAARANRMSERDRASIDVQL